MAERGGTVWLFTMGMMLLCLLIVVEGDTYAVGDRMGWGFQTDPALWVAGKTFKAGDTLLFNYYKSFHDVVVVDANGYETCTPGISPRYNTGNDMITLNKGTNYFICSFPEHCSLAGVRLAVTAE